MTDEKTDRVSWSYSKRSTFEQCQRQYYYEYFGSNEHVALDEPDKEKLLFLKRRVLNCYLASGNALHTVIKSYFRHAKKREVWDTNRLINFGRTIYQKDWTYSKSHPKGKFIPEERYPPRLFQEYYYSHPNAEQICADELERLINALSSFSTHELYRPFHENIQLDLVVEHKINLVNFPCNVLGQVDLAYKKNGNVIIVDWKLGQEDGKGDNSLQLAAYALWAMNYFDCSPDNLYVCKIHVSSNKYIRFNFDSQTVEATRIRIIQDAERMEMMEEYGKNGISEAFTRCEKPHVCNMCKYREVCYA